MKVKNPILSICIPTYNRANLLAESLDSILESVKGFENEVEIIISDNASTDNTLDVVREFQKMTPSILYSRNNENVIDENFFIAITMAHGDYVWLFADDDLMEKNAVKVVVTKIKEGYNLIISNYSKWDKDFTQLLAPKEYLFNKNIFIKNHNVLLKKFSIRIQFISSVIIKRSLILSVNNHEYEALHEFGISYIYTIYSSIVNGLRGIFIKDTLVKYRGYNSDIIGKEKWYKYFVTGSNLLFRLLEQKGYKSHSICVAKNIVLKKYVFHDISNRKRNDEDIGGLFKCLLPFYKYSIFFWVAIVPLLILPSKLIIITRNILLKSKNLV